MTKDEAGAVRITFGKRFNQKTVAEIAASQGGVGWLNWLVRTLEMGGLGGIAPNSMNRRIYEAAVTYLGGVPKDGRE